MNSDNIPFVHTDISSHSWFLTLVPLGTSFVHAPLISDEFLSTLSGILWQNKKSLLLYNRRGSGRAWICQDCGYFPRCPHCDIALAYHTSPTRRLICHQCGYIDHISIVCPWCAGSRFQMVGVGIQRIESDIIHFFPQAKILRIDSDIEIKKSALAWEIKKSDIILGTYSSLPLLHQNIDQIVFLLFESDLALPDYRMEEELYHTLEYAKKSGKNILIQTYLQTHPLLSILLDGNYHDFLSYMSEERKKFSYPPYAEFALIHVRDKNKDKVTELIIKLVNKIEILKEDAVFLAYDRDIWERQAWEWAQKIILKWKNLTNILKELEVEIVRNRSINLEWR